MAHAKSNRKGRSFLSPGSKGIRVKRVEHLGSIGCALVEPTFNTIILTFDHPRTKSVDDMETLPVDLDALFPQFSFGSSSTLSYSEFWVPELSCGGLHLGRWIDSIWLRIEDDGGSKEAATEVHISWGGRCVHKPCH